MNQELRHVATDVPKDLRNRMYKVIETYGLTVRGFMRQAILKHVLHYEKSKSKRKKK